MTVTIRQGSFDPTAIIRKLLTRPSDVATIRIDRLTAGFLVRHHIRAAFNVARVHGAEVEVHEERGLLGSAFAVRIAGTPEQIMPALRRLEEIWG